jgi:hypothetical protein
MSPLKVKAMVLPSGEMAGYRIQLAPCGEVDGNCATAAGAAQARSAAAMRHDFICMGAVVSGGSGVWWRV